MVDKKLNEGDVVKLKSGGPLMTVVWINEQDVVGCHWFKDDELKFERFKTIELSPEKTPK